jgi:hypothetical protein
MGKFIDRVSLILDSLPSIEFFWRLLNGSKQVNKKRNQILYDNLRSYVENSDPYTLYYVSHCKNEEMRGLNSACAKPKAIWRNSAHGSNFPHI